MEMEMKLIMEGELNFFLEQHRKGTQLNHENDVIIHKKIVHIYFQLKKAT